VLIESSTIRHYVVGKLESVDGVGIIYFLGYQLWHHSITPSSAHLVRLAEFISRQEERFPD
jgi:hypothetical protein